MQLAMATANMQNKESDKAAVSPVEEKEREDVPSVTADRLRVPGSSTLAPIPNACPRREVRGALRDVGVGLLRRALERRALRRARPSAELRLELAGRHRDPRG